MAALYNQYTGHLLGCECDVCYSTNIRAAPIMEPIERAFTSGESELIATALEEYAGLCDKEIQELLGGLTMDQIDGMEGLQDAIKDVFADIHNRVKMLRQWKNRASTLAWFIRQNPTFARCLILIPEQL